MLLSLLATICGFAVVGLGLAWPIAARLSVAPAEKLLASAALSLLTVFGVGWLVFVLSLPNALLWALPVLAAAGLASHWREACDTWRDADARRLLLAQATVTAWCLGWLATVATYSGGGWTADWFEHWERARFFLEQSARDQVFIGHAAVTARPPLANVVTAAGLALTRADFAHYQVLSTLAASLAFLPAALLARRFGASHAMPTLAALLLANPLFVQNATFAWTKLPAAFFTLAGLYFYLGTWSAERPVSRAALCGACLGAGILAHYSAGPYALVLVVGWVLGWWRRRREVPWWRASWAAFSAGAAVLAVWFGWAFATYGVSATLLANTSVTAVDERASHQLVRIALNLRDTIVPHFVRTPDATLIAQASPWGAVRDAWFQLYQVNLLFAFGSLGGIALLAVLWRSARDGSGSRRAWAAFISAVVVLGVSVHGARDTWGLTHICLQPLVLLGLAFLAARWHTLARTWRIALATAAVVDGLLGIALHFAVQAFAIEHWLGPQAFANWQMTHSTAAVMNLAAKLHHQLRFVADVVPPSAALVALGAAAAGAIALWKRSKRAVAVNDG